MKLETKEKLEPEPKEIIQNAIDQYELTHIYVGFSGGKDSVVVADYADRHFHEQFKKGGIIFCDTGIRAQETVDFVKAYCKERNWNLHIVHPRKSFEDIVKGEGFPKQAIHTIIMRYLKYIPMRNFIKSRINNGEKPAILSGVRKAESDRRRINASKPIHRDGKLIFVSPMIYKSNAWMLAYFDEFRLKRSPVYKTLHISGDCFCGCFAQIGESKLIDTFHPDVAKQIRDLENWISKNGSSKVRKNSTWEKRIGSMVGMQKQMTLEESMVCNECAFDRPPEDDFDIIKELDVLDEAIQKM